MQGNRSQETKASLGGSREISLEPLVPQARISSCSPAAKAVLAAAAVTTAHCAPQALAEGGHALFDAKNVCALSILHASSTDTMVRTTAVYWCLGTFHVSHVGAVREEKGRMRTGVLLTCLTMLVQQWLRAVLNAADLLSFFPSTLGWYGGESDTMCA
eukprot:1160041-Pelagomonas_calceolata.AAC.11